MKKAFLLFLFSTTFLLSESFGQKGSITNPNADNVFRILFYNTENFFDTFDDPKTDDNEFLPQSKRHWTYQRYEQKLNNISKVYLSLGIQPPAIIGMSEIENDKVLVDLTQKTPLQKFNYKFIHHDSPDIRGIDVAIIYRPDKFRPIKNSFFEIKFPSDAHKRTREILYTKGIANTTDTLHIFVNHWPSRVSGQAKSEPFRNVVAKILRTKVDSIFAKSPNAKIIIIGDFNDNPDDESIAELTTGSRPGKTTLIDISNLWLKDIAAIGTIKFKGNWSVFDQIIISPQLYNTKNKGLKFVQGSAKIDNLKFLLKDDKKYGGSEPFRTYNGYHYEGGFSDHLPVYFDLINQ